MDIHETVLRWKSSTVDQDAAQDDPIGAISIRSGGALLARRAELLGTRDRGRCTIETVTCR
ncbi:hypothetical protein ACWCXH_29085 [Kitasatospora sp. NPDC001660]